MAHLAMKISLGGSGFWVSGLGGLGFGVSGFWRFRV